MTCAEVGFYIRLLCAQWTRGPLPNDDSELIRFAGGDKNARRLLRQVKPKFTLQENGKLANKRMEIERERQIAWRAQQALKGQQSGTSRRTTVQPEFNRSSTPVQPRAGSTPVEPSTNSSSSSSSSPQREGTYPLNPPSDSPMPPSPTSDGFALNGEMTKKGKLTLAIMQRAACVFKGTDELRLNHRRWLERATEEPDKFERVIAEVESHKGQGKSFTKSPGAMAEQLWKEFT